jgi:hypothetical protein
MMLKGPLLCTIQFADDTRVVVKCFCSTPALLCVVFGRLFVMLWSLSEDYYVVYCTVLCFAYAFNLNAYAKQRNKSS